MDDSFYRAQVEHDLRAKLLRLRQKAAGMLSDEDLLRRLLADSLSTFCVLFRHALHLSGRRGADGEAGGDRAGAGARSDSTRSRSRSCWICARSASSRAISMPARTAGSAICKGIAAVIDAVDRSREIGGTHERLLWIVTC